MIFSAAEFLFLFLPCVLLVYYNPFFKSRKFKNIFLLLVSVFFYAWGEPVRVLLLLVSMSANWFFGLLEEQDGAHRRWAMGGAVHFSFDSSLWIMAYVCVASIVSYCLWYGIVKEGELSKLFIIKFAEPVFACLFGAILLGENVFKLQYLISFLLISGGILISNARAFKKRNLGKKE